MSVIYNPINWQDGESGGTSLDATNLNHMEQGIVDTANEVNALEKNFNDVTEQIEDIETKVNETISFAILRLEENDNQLENQIANTTAELMNVIATVSANLIDEMSQKADRIENSTSGHFLTLTDVAKSKDTPLSLTLYGKCEQSGNPTPDTPQEITVAGADGDIALTSCRKNLLPFPYVNSGTVEKNGVTFVINGDGSIKRSGTAKAYAELILQNNLSYKAGTYYTNVSCYVNSKEYTGCWNGTRTFTSDFTLSSVSIQVASGTTVNDTFYPIISTGSTEWERYIGTTATIPLTDGLAGIPVSSGGNYVDENGQQWVCDTIERYADGIGKYIQRAKKLHLTSDMGWTYSASNNLLSLTNVITDFKQMIFNYYGHGIPDNVLCNYAIFDNTIYQVNQGKMDGFTMFVHATSGNKVTYFQFTNITSLDQWKTFLDEHEVYIYYPLAEPIETDLTAEQVAELKKIHTFYPVTNVFTDDIGDVGMKYVADTKASIDNLYAYIDSKFNELTTALLSVVGSEV